MVNGRSAEGAVGRSQRSEVRGQRSEVRGQRSEVRGVIPSATSIPFPNSVSVLSPFVNMKPYLSLRRSWQKHQLADGVEDDLELGVIFVFQRRKLAGEFCVREEHLAQT